MKVSRFTLIAGAQPGGDAAAALEQFVQDLRSELADAGAKRIEPIPSAATRSDVRGIEALVLIGLLLTLVQAGDSMLNIANAIRSVITRHARRREQLTLTVNGVELDLADPDTAHGQILALAQDAPAEEGGDSGRYALVIVNGTYDDSRLGKLRSPAHDGAALRRVLGDADIGGFQVSLVQDGTVAEVRDALSTFFANRERDDLLLVHFSCHGVKSPTGRLYLAARDTDLSNLGGLTIGASFVHELLAETSSQRVVLILDCCYSGAFGRAANLRLRDHVAISEEFGSGVGRVVITSSTATEYAFEAGVLQQSDERPSVFTEAFVEGLESGAADLDRDGEVTVDDLFKYVGQRVRQSTPDQKPMRWVFGDDGSLVIARSHYSQLPHNVVEYVTSDKVHDRLHAVGVLSVLLQGPLGRRQAAMAALVQLNELDDSLSVRSAARRVIEEATGTTADDTKPTAPGASTAKAPTVEAVSPSRSTDKPDPRPPAAPPVGLGRRWLQAAVSLPALSLALSAAGAAGAFLYVAERGTAAAVTSGAVAAVLAHSCYAAVSAITRRSAPG